MASSNIQSILVTLDVSQPPMYALNALALLNIASMFQTFDTFHLLMSALNADALKNIKDMFLTSDVFHLSGLVYSPLGAPLLNEMASLNIFPMSVTLDVSQSPMYALNDLAPRNK